MDEILTCKECGWSGSWKECSARIVSEPMITQQGKSINAVDVCPCCGDAIRPTVVGLVDETGWKEWLEKWLQENAPEILQEYEDHFPQDLTETYFLDLPFWVGEYHPEVIEVIRKQIIK